MEAFCRPALARQVEGEGYEGAITEPAELVGEEVSRGKQGPGGHLVGQQVLDAGQDELLPTQVASRYNLPAWLVRPGSPCS